MQKEKKYEFSVVPGTYDEGKTPDAGRYQADRSGDRTGGCKNSAQQQESGY